MLWTPKKPYLILPGDEDYQPPSNCYLMPHRMMMASVASGVTYRYFRLDITAVNGGTRLAVGEFEIMVSGTAYPTSNMTSNVLPSPLVASGNSEQSGLEAYRGFDGGTGGWRSASGTAGWLKIDLGSGNGVNPTGYKVTESVDTNIDNSPKDWTFEGSNTGSFSGEEIVLDTQTTQSFSADEVKEYTL